MGEYRRARRVITFSLDGRPLFHPISWNPRFAAAAPAPRFASGSNPPRTPFVNEDDLAEANQKMGPAEFRIRLVA